MSTTSLFVELLIIGFQAIAWVFLLMGSMFGPSWAGHIGTAFVKAAGPCTVAALAIAYFLGVFLDEVFDWLVEPFARRIRDSLRNGGMPEMWSVQAYVFARGEKSIASLDYMRGRVRVLRSSIFNVWLIAATGVAFLWRAVPSDATWRTGAILAAGLGGTAIAIVIALVYRRLERAYWLRVRGIYSALTGTGAQQDTHAVS